MEGRIQLGAEPLREGWVTLLPIAGTLGDVTIAPIDAQGRFQTDRAPVGPLAVRVNLPKSTLQSLAESRPALARHFRLVGGPNSPLRTTTTADGSNLLELDLLGITNQRP